MASIFQQIGSALGVSSQSSQASTVSVPGGSTNVAFSLDLNNIGVFNGENLYVAAPGNSTITLGDNSDHNILIGGAGGTDILSGGSGPDLIIGGTGTNVESGGGGTDIFAHQAGATDYITDFSPAADEKIALPQGVSFTGSQAVTVPSTVSLPAGVSHDGIQLSFSDGSKVTVLDASLHPDSNWFI